MCHADLRVRTVYLVYSVCCAPNNTLHRARAGAREGGRVLGRWGRVACVSPRALGSDDKTSERGCRCQVGVPCASRARRARVGAVAVSRGARGERVRTPPPSHHVNRHLRDSVHSRFFAHCPPAYRASHPASMVLSRLLIATPYNDSITVRRPAPRDHPSHFPDTACPKRPKPAPLSPADV